MFPFKAVDWTYITSNLAVDFCQKNKPHSHHVLQQLSLPQVVQLGNAHAQFTELIEK